MHSALQEHYGGSRDVALTANRTLPIPGYQNAIRFWRFTPDAAGRVVTLPNATRLRTGGDPQFVLWNEGPDSIAVRDNAAGAILTLTAGTVVRLVLKGNATAAGSWIYRTATAAAGSALAANRVPLDLVLEEDVVDFNLRDYWDANGYDGESAASLRVTFGRSSYQFTAGASATTIAGFDTGEWPAGTTLLLLNHGLISGRGGAGGRGGDVPPGLLSSAGEAGGPGLRTYVDTAIVNYGTIQGGGGGGGGSAYHAASNTAGGGGGGGQGYQHSAGGAPGQGGGGSPGMAGGAYGPGNGGGNTATTVGGQGGTAGASGNAGSPSGAAGGAGGDAITRLTGTTVTLITTGTITGAQTTF